MDIRDNRVLLQRFPCWLVTYILPLTLSITKHLYRQDWRAFLPYMCSVVGRYGRIYHRSIYSIVWGTLCFHVLDGVRLCG